MEASRELKERPNKTAGQETQEKLEKMIKEKKEKKPRVVKPDVIELLKKVGLDYSSFDPKEVALIIEGSMINKQGIAKNRYLKLLNNLNDKVEFTSKLIKYNDRFSANECVELSKELKTKFDAIKSGELDELKKKRELLDKQIKEIEESK